MRFRKWIGLLAIAVLAAGCAAVKTVEIQQNDKVVIEREKQEEKAAVAGEQGRLAEPDADQPARITSEKMQYREDGRVTVFQGNVQVNQADAWLFSPYLEVRSEKGMAYARQGVRLIDHGRGVTATAKEMDYNRDMTDVMLRKQVKVSTHDDEGNRLNIYCGRMRWNEQEDAAVARDDVVVHYKDTTATADTMSYYRLQKTMILQGAEKPDAERPLVLQGPNTITGDTITLHIKDRVYEVEGSAKAIVLPESDQAKKTE